MWVAESEYANPHSQTVRKRYWVRIPKLIEPACFLLSKESLATRESSKAQSVKPPAFS